MKTQGLRGSAVPAVTWRRDVCGLAEGRQRSGWILEMVELDTIGLGRVTECQESRGSGRPQFLIGAS